jgi:hypothetical protein
MKPETKLLRDKYRAMFGEAYIRKAFQKRTEERMFEEVGLPETTEDELEENPKAAVWKGYEILVGAGDYAEVK